MRDESEIQRCFSESEKLKPKSGNEGTFQVEKVKTVSKSQSSAPACPADFVFPVKFDVDKLDSVPQPTVDSKFDQFTKDGVKYAMAGKMEKAVEQFTLSTHFQSSSGE